MVEKFQFDEASNELYKSKLQKKLDDNIYGQQIQHLKEINRGYPEYICSTRGYKKKKLKDLTIEEKIDIINDVMVEKDYHDNICSRFGIGRESIKTLLKNIKKDPSYLR